MPTTEIQKQPTDWVYLETPQITPPEGSVGFIYRITNVVDGRKYIGKKQFYFAKTSYRVVTQKNGIKKRKKIKTQVESDWKEYFGSSDELKLDIERLGVQNFHREILEFCSSLTSLSYAEAKHQFMTDALLKPDEYYNSWIMVRVRRNNLLSGK